MDATFDVIILGCGIAGASLAYELSARHRILLLERESRAGYHATGRSAALFSTTYGNPTIQALSRASQRFFEQPPGGFCEVELLKKRGALLIAREEQRAQLQALAETPGLEWLEGTPLYRLARVLRPGMIVAGLWEGAASDVDVAALHEGYLRAVRARASCRLLYGAENQVIERTGGQWRVAACDQTFRAPVLVNAAGAWADEVARGAGITPLGVQPKKRTAAIVATEGDSELGELPMVIDAEEQFYFKPDAGRLLVSPADETDSTPADVWADDLEVAQAVERIEQVTTLNVARVIRAWAGLRTFTRDRSPAVGFDPRDRSFFWLVGQGGYGIQTAPALSRLAAALIDPTLGDPLSAPLQQSLSPARFSS